jgi:hypothetical protein
VNDAPVAQAAVYETPIDTPLSGQLVATDVEGSPLTYAITTLPVNGSVIVNPATGEFTYTPNPGRTGTDSFKFRANDGALNSSIKTISIVIKSPIPD